MADLIILEARHGSALLAKGMTPIMVRHIEAAFIQVEDLQRGRDSTSRRKRLRLFDDIRNILILRRQPVSRSANYIAH